MLENRRQLCGSEGCGKRKSGGSPYKTEHHSSEYHDLGCAIGLGLLLSSGHLQDEEGNKAEREREAGGEEDPGHGLVLVVESNL